MACSRTLSPLTGTDVGTATVQLPRRLRKLATNQTVAAALMLIFWADRATSAEVVALCLRSLQTLVKVCEGSRPYTLDHVPYTLDLKQL